MHSDENTTIEKLKRLLKNFRDKRDWAQFHDPKNLAEAISIEAAELLQLFLWKNSDAVADAMKTDRKFRAAVEEELADVFCFGLNFANSAGIDVSQIIIRKIERNNAKYPVLRSKGVSTKYNKL